jgi:hypothetical protein
MLRWLHEETRREEAEKIQREFEQEDELDRLRDERERREGERIINQIADRRRQERKDLEKQKSTVFEDSEEEQGRPNQEEQDDPMQTYADQEDPFTLEDFTRIYDAKSFPDLIAAEKFKNAKIAASGPM